MARRYSRARMFMPVFVYRLPPITILSISLLFIQQQQQPFHIDTLQTADCTVQRVSSRIHIENAWNEMFQSQLNVNWILLLQIYW